MGGIVLETYVDKAIDEDKQQIIKNLIKRNQKLEDIAEDTGYSLERVKEIANSINI